MKLLTGARTMLVATVLTAAAGFFLRRYVLAGGSAVALIVLSAVLAAAALAGCLRLPRQPQFAALFRRSLLDAVLSVAGGVLMGVGGFLMLAQSSGVQRIPGVLALLAAACLVLAALRRSAGETPSPWIYVVAVLFYVVKLFCDFRRWMVDPALLDYCFWLFAAISFMLTTFHTAQFCFDLGKRRTLAFFALTGVYFGIISLADLRGSDALLCGGSTLWMLACAWQALRSQPTKRSGGEQA